MLLLVRLIMMRAEGTRIQLLYGTVFAMRQTSSVELIQPCSNPQGSAKFENFSLHWKS